MMAPIYIYLHGFNSSPASLKAQQFNTAITQLQPDARVVIPELLPWPAQAMQQIEALVADLIQVSTAPLVFLGSSLGGYYATYLAQKYGTPAILINPAVKPYEQLATMLGRQQNRYTHEVYELSVEHIQQLIDLKVQNLTVAKQLLVLLQTGDEVLDYRLAARAYLGSEVNIEQGGDHGYQHFDQRVPQILAFVAQQVNE